MTGRPLRAASAAVLVALGAATLAAAASPPPQSAAERTFARTAPPIDAHEITGHLFKYTGTHVNFVCTVASIVHSDTMITQCGRANEPVDLYVIGATAGLHVGSKLRVLGEMMVPGQWTDVTGHTWLTPFVKAHFIDRF